jgi:hypothetical protein
MSVDEPGPPTPSEIDANSVSKRVNVNSHSLERKRTPHRTDEHPYRPACQPGVPRSTQRGARQPLTCSSHCLIRQSIPLDPRLCARENLKG